MLTFSLCFLSLFSLLSLPLLSVFSPSSYSQQSPWWVLEYKSSKSLKRRLALIFPIKTDRTESLPLSKIRTGNDPPPEIDSSNDFDSIKKKREPPIFTEKTTASSSWMDLLLAVSSTAAEVQRGDRWLPKKREHFAFLGRDFFW